MIHAPRLFVAAGIFHPEAGGPATYLYEILPALQARGWDVRLLTYGDAPVTDYPYPVTRIPRRALPLRLRQYDHAARQHLQWADLVYAHTIDLPLHGDNRARRIIKIVGDQAWERCIRRGWIPPDEDIDVFQTRRYGPVVTWQRRSRSKQVRAMDAVIVPSEYLKRMVMQWGVPEASIHVIYNALPPAETIALTQAEARQQLNLDDAPTILTAARLEPWKGIEHLINALHAVPDVHLIVAGDGPQRQRLQVVAESLGRRVMFLGKIPRADLMRYMCAADYFALYSGYEGLPHTLLESLRVGTPVIASEKGGNVEVVQHGVNGLLVPYVDVDALIAAVRTVTDATQRAALAAKTQHGLERFRFDVMVEQTDAVLNQYLP